MKVMTDGLVMAAVFCAMTAAAQPRTFVQDPVALETVRKAIQSQSKEYAAALKNLRKQADKALKVQPVSVTDKTALPPSGNRHDYMSLGKYWWPDPKKADGKPYIRRDGEVNPESDQFPDHAKFRTMMQAVTTLSLAYYFTGQEEYAEHASRLLRVWYVDTATCMNPNLNYAQAIPGRNDGRGAGIIDLHQTPDVIDAIGLLGASPSLTQDDRKGLLRWFREYLRWLRESPNGIDESDAPNNHGTWYDIQVVSTALFVGDKATAAEMVAAAKEKRIKVQIEPDGSQPKELVRTRSFGYSMFNLTALTTLAGLGERLGIDLWSYETADGRSIRKVITHLLPYITGEKEWTGKQITQANTAEMYPVLIKAALVYNDAAYAAAVRKMPVENPYSKTTMLQFGGEQLKKVYERH